MGGSTAIYTLWKNNNSVIMGGILAAREYFQVLRNARQSAAQCVNLQHIIDAQKQTIEQLKTQNNATVLALKSQIGALRRHGDQHQLTKQSPTIDVDNLHKVYQAFLQGHTAFTTLLNEKKSKVTDQDSHDNITKQISSLMKKYKRALSNLSNMAAPTTLPHKSPLELCLVSFPLLLSSPLTPYNTLEALHTEFKTMFAQLIRQRNKEHTRYQDIINIATQFDKNAKEHGDKLGTILDSYTNSKHLLQMLAQRKNNLLRAISTTKVQLTTRIEKLTTKLNEPKDNPSISHGKTTTYFSWFVRHSKRKSPAHVTNTVQQNLELVKEILENMENAERHLDTMDCQTPEDLESFLQAYKLQWNTATNTLTPSITS
jgi:hypothetical protein